MEKLCVHIKTIVINSNYLIFTDCPRTIRTKLNIIIDNYFIFYVKRIKGIVAHEFFIRFRTITVNFPYFGMSDFNFLYNMCELFDKISRLFKMSICNFEGP